MSWIFEDLQAWINDGCNVDLGNKVIDLGIPLCRISVFPKEICKLINLQELDCCGNKISILPKEIDHLVNLREFYCYRNQISVLPTELAKLINLREFNCSDNQISVLPKEIGQLVNLQEFNCSDNQISVLPKEIGQLVNLQEFNCSDNKISVLPKEIDQLINLREFNCSNNQISVLPKEIEQLTNLQTFNCSYNKISVLPIELNKLTNLQELYCYNNQILILPKEIGQLTNLQEFRCSYNKIMVLLKEIGQLINLKTFSCSQNQISSLPKELGRLTNLRYFNCENNQISSLPIELTNCGNCDFRYSNNPIEYIAPQVQRWLDKINFTQKIYNDAQSVHNHRIQQGITNSINYIMQRKPELCVETLKIEIINNTILNQQTKELLFEYTQDNSVHSVLNITFEELLISVYDFILKHEHKNEIFLIVNLEMADSLCKCFTGRMSRLINCLNGFDENIIVNISDTEQIGNICIIERNKLEQDNNFTEEKFKENVRKALEERKYNEDVIVEWLDNI